MHYGDKIQQNKNYISIIIYIHDDLTSPGKRDLQLTSIKKCRYIQPRLFESLIRSCHEELMKFEEIRKLKSETWYLINMNEKENKLNLVSIKDVSEVKNDLYRLH